MGTDPTESDRANEKTDDSIAGAWRDQSLSLVGLPSDIKAFKWRNMK